MLTISDELSLSNERSFSCGVLIAVFCRNICSIQFRLPTSSCSSQGTRDISGRKLLPGVTRELFSRPRTSQHSNKKTEWTLSIPPVPNRNRRFSATSHPQWGTNFISAAVRLSVETLTVVLRPRVPRVPVGKRSKSENQSESNRTSFPVCLLYRLLANSFSPNEGVNSALADSHISVNWNPSWAKAYHLMYMPDICCPIGSILSGQSLISIRSLPANQAAAGVRIDN